MFRVGGNKVLGNKRGQEQMQAESKRTDEDWYDFEKQLDRFASKRMVEKVRSKSFQLSRCGMDTKCIGGGKTTDNEVIQDDKVLLQSRDITKSSREKGREISIVVSKKPNAVKVQEDVSPSIVRDVLNLFKEKVRMLSNENKARAKEQRKACLLYVEAAMLLKKQQKWVNTEKLIGSVPGIEIGDRFQFRAELVVVGLHHHFRNGIDYMTINGKNIATSIVKSGRYDDNSAESSDHLIYSGQGGNPRIIGKPPKDQKLIRGNLALKNSMDEEIPVRVTLKREGSQKPFTYRGLYLVTNCRQERGVHGKLVYEFDLNRLVGQPKLNGVNVGMPKKSKVFKLPRLAAMPKKSKVLKSPRLAADDISQGKEGKPVRVVNILEGCSRMQK